MFSSGKQSNYPYSYSISLPSEAALDRSRGPGAAVVVSGDPRGMHAAKRVKDEVATQPGLGFMVGEDPVGTDKDDGVMLVILKLEGGGSWSRILDDDDLACGDPRSKISASLV